MLRDANPRSFNAIYLICGFTDMRYGMDTLAAIIENRYKLSLFVPNTLFLFCGKRANKIRGLVWEGDGFLLLYKRLDNGLFQWPKTETEAMKLTDQQKRWLTEGLALEQPKAIKPGRPGVFV